MDCLQLTWKKWFLCLEPDFQFSLFFWTIISTLSRQTHSKKVIFMKMKYNFHQQRVNCRQPGAPPSTRNNGYLAGAGATAIKFRKPNWVWSFRPMVFTSFFFAIFSPLRGSSIRYAGVVHEISMNSVLRSFFLGYPQMTRELTVWGGREDAALFPRFLDFFYFVFSAKTPKGHTTNCYSRLGTARAGEVADTMQFESWENDTLLLLCIEKCFSLSRRDRNAPAARCIISLIL